MTLVGACVFLLSLNLLSAISFVRPKVLAQVIAIAVVASVGISFFLVTLAVLAKRLHDLDFPGWLAVLVFVPCALFAFVSFIAVGSPSVDFLTLCICAELALFGSLGAIKGSAGPNKYGAEPCPRDPAANVSAIFRRVSAQPNPTLVSRLNTLVKDSEDSNVVTAILTALDSHPDDARIVRTAIQCLGLVRDPRALGCITERFDDFRTAAENEPDSSLRSVWEGHFLAAGFAIVNLVYNNRSRDPKAIPYLRHILDSKVFSDDPNVYAAALVALERFQDVAPDIRDYIEKAMRRVNAMECQDPTRRFFSNPGD